jgi:hypothetical protein
MKAFWWYEPGAIAGMARPGFNSVHWFDLPFVEAALLGWLGQHSGGSLPLEQWRQHLSTYVPRIYPFYGLSDQEWTTALNLLASDRGLIETYGKLRQRTGIFADAELEGDLFRFEMNLPSLEREILYFRDQGIGHVVSLTEHAHQHEVLGPHFGLTHISIQDMHAPSVEQAHALAEVIRVARRRGEKVAVHCLAGIGRTSTMLMAAHMILGEPFESVLQTIRSRNPKFILTGPQGDFVRALANKGSAK